MAPPAEPPGAAARVSAATIKSFAESLGIANLPDDVATQQAADVEYRLRQIIQARATAKSRDCLLACWRAVAWRARACARGAARRERRTRQRRVLRPRAERVCV
jgi:hypothetical protein